MRTDAIEYVAKALRKQEWGHDLWRETDESDKEYWRQCAIAAIKAMDEWRFEAAGFGADSSQDGAVTSQENT